MIYEAFSLENVDSYGVQSIKLLVRRIYDQVFNTRSAKFMRKSILSPAHKESGKNKLLTYIEPKTLSADLLEIIAKEDNRKPYVAFKFDKV